MIPFHSNACRLLLTLAIVAPAAAQTSSLAGRVIDPNGSGINGIGVRLDGTAMGTTTATGDFLITGLNATDYDVEFRAPTTSWAPVLIENVQVSGPTLMGDIEMLPGAGLTGTVTDPIGTPLNGVNMNVYDVNGHRIFTPNDGTNALGQFSITVPLGQLRLRAVPPTGSSLVPHQQNITVTANLNVGIIQLEPGFQMTGSVVATFNGLPIGATKIVVFDSQTGLEMEWLKTTANTFGIFSTLMPTGLFALEIEPPPTNLHHGRILHNVVIVGATPLGPIQLDPGFIVTGVVNGPTGPLAGVDIDVITGDGYKLFTPNDNTNPTGLFSVIVPGGSYSVSIDPPPGNGLVGALVPITVAANTNMGTTTLVLGIPLTGKVYGPTGPVAGADIDVVDPITGEELVISGDDVDVNGDFQTAVPAGSWGLQVKAPQGSIAAPLLRDSLAVNTPTQVLVKMPSKSIIVDATATGIWTVPRGGSLPMIISTSNPSGTAQGVSYEFVVRYSSGAETPVIALPPVTLPPGAFLALGVAIPVPTAIPLSQSGRIIDMVFRARRTSTGSELDKARVEFEVQ